MVARVIVALTLIAVVTGVGPAPRVADVAAQSEAGTLDLPAMTLVPNDLAEPGYGTESSASLTRDGYAAILNDYFSGGVNQLEEVSTTLAEAGWRQTYIATLGLLNEDNPETLGRMIYMSLVEFADAAGAATGLALTRDAYLDFGYEEAGESLAVGDESVLLRFTGISEDDQPLHELDLLVQTDNLIVELDIINFSSEDPVVAELEPLAQTLLARIEEVRGEGEGGLGPMILRVDGADVSSDYDYYYLRDGEVIPNLGATEDELASDVVFYDDLGVTDVYYARQVFPASVGSEVSVSFLTTLYHFESEDAAAAWMAPIATEGPPGLPDGFENVELVEDADQLGDASATFSYDYADDQGAVHGYLIYLTVGEFGAIVSGDAASEVPLATIVALATGQADCLSAGACAARIPLPAASSG